MVTNVVIKFGWTMKIVEKYQFENYSSILSCLGKISNAIIFAIFGQSPKKVTACMIVILCIKFG